MKKTSTLSFFRSVFLSGRLFSSFAQAATHTVTVQNFSFTPSTLNVLVGDTVQWVWLGGTHNTTSLMVPNGASPWSASMTSATPTFSYVVTVAGTYAYQCTFHSTSMNATFTASGTGINEIRSLASGTVFPNPFSHSLKIDLRAAGFEKANGVQVYSLTGTRVYSQEVEMSSGSIFPADLSALPPGAYLLVVSSDDKVGRTIIVKSATD